METKIIEDNNLTERTIEARLARLERRRGDARGWKRLSVALAVGLVSVPFVVEAVSPVPHVFSNGQVISSSQVNENFAHLTNALTAAENRVPTGTVALFDLGACPSGWEVFEEARGRAIVGMPLSGTLRGTVGTAMTNREDRAHTHSVDVVSFSSGPGGAHNHAWYSAGTSYSANGQNVGVAPAMVAAGSGFTLASIAHNSSFHTSNESSHTHTINPVATTSTGASTSSVIPYVQLLVCRKM